MIAHEEETLRNVHDAIATLQEQTIAPLGGELVLSQSATSGLYLLLDTTKGALAYLLEQREKEKALKQQEALKQVTADIASAS